MAEPKDPLETLALVAAAAESADGKDAFAAEVLRTHGIFAQNRVKQLVAAFIAGAEADDETELERLVAMVRAGFKAGNPRPPGRGVA